MTWANLQYKQADYRVLPQAFDIFAIGINEHKTNNTGKQEWTSMSRHARGDQDAFAALADLLAHEIAIQSFRLIDMIMTQCDPSTSKEYQQLLWQGKVFFPKRDKTKQNQLVDQVRSLMKKLTTQVSGWDKDKSTALFRKTATGTALAAGADPNGVNKHWGGKVTLRAGPMLKVT